MTEFYEVNSHIPLQYVDVLDNIKILIIEDSNKILTEIEKYTIDKRNIMHQNDIKQIQDMKYDIIIIEKDYNIKLEMIDKFIKSTKILIAPTQTEKINNSLWNIFDYISKLNLTSNLTSNLPSNNNEPFNVKYSDIIYVSNQKINYYSNEINPHKYFVSFSNFYKKNIQTTYYKPDIHFRYLNVNDIILKTDNTIMGVHIMLDFAVVSFELLENTSYIKCFRLS